MSERPAPSPGWYPVGDGLFRYWDGVGWLGEAQTLSPPPPEEEPVGPELEVGPGQRKRRRLLTTLSIAFGVLAVVAGALGVYLLLSDGDAAEESSATAPQTSDQAVELAPDSEPEIQMPSAEEIMNSTLLVPSPRDDIPDYWMTFVNGAPAEPCDSELNGMFLGDVRLEEPLAWPVLDDQPYVLLRFMTMPGNHPLWSFGLYDADLELVQQLPWPDPIVTASMASECGTGPVVQVVGDQLTWEYNNLKTIGTSGDRYSCEGDRYSATVTFTWNGTEYVSTDIVYHTPHGDSRPPDLEQIQWIYHQIAAGQEGSVAEFLAVGALDDRLEGAFFIDDDPAISGADPSDPAFFSNRAAYFAEDGVVKSCVPVGPAGVQYDMGGGYMLDAGPLSRAEVGDYDCTVSAPSRADHGLLTDYKLEVRTDATGNPTILTVHCYR